MLKLLVVPVQVPPPFVYDGVTVMVAVTGTADAFVAVNARILPEPLDDRPMEVVVLFQLYTVPGTSPVKVTCDVVDPLHTTCEETPPTVGSGFTVTFLTVAADAVHPVEGRV